MIMSKNIILLTVYVKSPLYVPFRLYRFPDASEALETLSQ